MPSLIAGIGHTEILREANDLLSGPNLVSLHSSALSALNVRRLIVMFRVLVTEMPSNQLERKPDSTTLTYTVP